MTNKEEVESERRQCDYDDLWLDDRPGSPKEASFWPESGSIHTLLNKEIVIL